MNLHYQSLGEGEPLIIIHGLFGSADNWRSMAKYFSRQYRVISVDLRNHGRSAHSDEQTFTVMADDISQLCDHLALNKVSLLGHSLGGKVAMKFAELFPQKVHKLIVVDISPRQYEGEHTPLMDAMLALDLSRFSSRSEVDEALTDEVPDKTVRQFLLMNLVSDNDQLKWRINLPALKANYRQCMQAVCEQAQCVMPSLFIYGEQSEYVTPADRELITTIFKQVEFAAVPAGHWVHAERPQQFKQIVEDFLQDD